MYSETTVHIRNDVSSRTDEDNRTVQTQSELVRAIGMCVLTTSTSFFIIKLTSFLDTSIQERFFHVKKINNFRSDLTVICPCADRTLGCSQTTGHSRTCTRAILTADAFAFL